MAVSTSALIPRVRNQLDDNPFATSGSASSASSVVAVTDGTDWEEGAIGEFSSDGEQWKVKSIVTNDLTCFRGWNGTTAATHTSSETVYRDPIYGYKQISDALTVALNRLWPYAWKTESVSLTPSATTLWYDMTATCMAIIEANQIIGSSPADLRSFGIDGKPFAFRRNLPAALVASGVGMRFAAGLWHATNTVNVTAAARITGTSDIEDSTTLPVGDALVTGALGYLVGNKQIPRVSSMANRDEMATVSNTARLQTGVVYEQQFVQKLQMLRILHDQLYPIAREWR